MTGSQYKMVDNTINVYCNMVYTLLITIGFVDGTEKEYR